MKIRGLLAAMVVLSSGCMAADSVMVNSAGVLKWPTNFVAANHLLTNAMNAGQSGTGSVTVANGNVSIVFPSATPASTGTAESVAADLAVHEATNTAHAALFAGKVSTNDSRYLSAVTNESDPIWTAASNLYVPKSATNNSEWGSHAGLYPRSNPSNYVDRAAATSGMQVAGAYLTNVMWASYGIVTNLIITGAAANPSVAGFYSRGADYGGHATWVNAQIGYVTWYGAGSWYVSQVAGSQTPISWESDTSAFIGTYSPMFGSTGSLTIAYTTNTLVLSGIIAGNGAGLTNLPAAQLTGSGIAAAGGLTNEPIASAHVTNLVPHVSVSDRTNWNGKATLGDVAAAGYVTNAVAASTTYLNAFGISTTNAEWAAVLNSLYASTNTWAVYTNQAFATSMYPTHNSNTLFFGCSWTSTDPADTLYMGYNDGIMAPARVVLIGCGITNTAGGDCLATFPNWTAECYDSTFNQSGGTSDGSGVSGLHVWTLGYYKGCKIIQTNTPNRTTTSAHTVDDIGTSYLDGCTMIRATNITAFGGAGKAYTRNCTGFSGTPTATFATPLLTDARAGQSIAAWEIKAATNSAGANLGYTALQPSATNAIIAAARAGLLATNGDIGGLSGTLGVGQLGTTITRTVGGIITTGNVQAATFNGIAFGLVQWSTNSINGTNSVSCTVGTNTYHLRLN